ncbi:hypothetical protein RRG08_056917, partial [Elysia crispata]
ASDNISPNASDPYKYFVADCISTPYALVQASKGRTSYTRKRLSCAAIFQRCDQSGQTVSRSTLGPRRKLELEDMSMMTVSVQVVARSDAKLLLGVY